MKGKDTMPTDRRGTLSDSLSSIIDVMDIAMWELDTNFRIVDYNQKARKIYGNNIVGQFCYTIADDRDRVCANCPAQRVYNGHTSGRSEHHRTTVNGGHITIDHIATPIRNENGELTGALVLIIDITHQKRMERELIDHRNRLEDIVRDRTAAFEAANLSLQQEIADRIKAENALKKSEKKFRTIFENLQDVYFETTLDGDILTASPSALDLSGYTIETLLRSRVDMLYVDPADREPFLRKLKQKGTVRNYEMRFKRKDGTCCDVSINADLAFSENGQPEGLTETIRDITLQKRFKQKTQRLKKMESLGLMAGGIAHDLNNILSGIVSYPDLLLMDLAVDSPYRRPIEIIKDSGQRAAEVVCDLLTIARGVATGKMVQDLNTIVHEFLNSGEFLQLQTDYPDVRFRVDLHSDILTIKCSSPHMKKTLMNLVMNAAEAIQAKGSVSITTACCLQERSPQNNTDRRSVKYVTLSVKDTGRGISKEDMDRIFEPFYTKKVMGRSGTGLGLAVVWNTVQDHGGQIDVRSGPDGTTMELFFPQVSKLSPHLDRTAQSKSIRGNGQRILVVDDEANQREIASDLLRKLGYVVETAASGDAAIAMTRRKAFDLLVLDMVMTPGISGRETYEQIVQFRPGQKAIIASGFTESEDVRAAQKLGAGRFIEKPYTVEKIGAAVLKELQGLR
jgi:two-component system cell cycle sensor histidine kinase/response regulator CckA